MTPEQVAIAAVVAAAGRSLRMGEPKQLLPWHGTTVLAATVENLAAAGAAPVACVLGHRRDDMAAALRGTPAVVVDNPSYLEGEMLSSYQAGVHYLTQHADQSLAGTLLALGDQPHIPVKIIRQVLAQACMTPEAIVIPSYRQRRGHPFFLPRALWPELLSLRDGQTLRTLVHRYGQTIVYVTVDDDAILRDIDTPADYRALVPPQAP